MKTIVHKSPKAIDMRLNGLKFQHAQYQFEFLLWRGHENRAKYPKKYHPPNNHINMWGEYVVDVLPQ